MNAALFGDFPRGTLYAMLKSAYQANPELTLRDLAAWKEFDDFVYDRLPMLEKYGFISVENGEPVGFISWDPRGLPAEIRIGHNCILPAFRGCGRGKKQLGLALERMKHQLPETITVVTGTDAFFAPARGMYEANGLTQQADVAVAPGCVAYRLTLQER
jgi:hypothetical protein